MLTWGINQGRVNLLAAGLSVTLTDGACSLDVVLTNDGAPNTPIAVPLTPLSYAGSALYQTPVCDAGEGTLAPGVVYDDAVTVYRTALANANGRVEIITEGFLNNIMELMQSPADGISPLTGTELIAAKVSRIWVGGGQFPSGTEYNFSQVAQARTAAAYVTSNWPIQIPMTFLGFEVGGSVVTGSSLNGLQATDYVSLAFFEWCGGCNRSSWGAMNTLLAVLGEPTIAGYTTVEGTISVNPTTGANTFAASAGGPHRYVVKVSADATFQAIIQQLARKDKWATYDPY